MSTLSGIKRRRRKWPTYRPASWTPEAKPFLYHRPAPYANEMTVGWWRDQNRPNQVNIDILGLRK